MKGRLIGAAFIIAMLAIVYFDLREILAFIFPIAVVLYVIKVMTDTYVKPYQIASHSYKSPGAIWAWIPAPPPNRATKPEPAGIPPMPYSGKWT